MRTCLIAGGGTGGHLFPRRSRSRSELAARGDAPRSLRRQRSGLERAAGAGAGFALELLTCRADCSAGAARGSRALLVAIALPRRCSNARSLVRAASSASLVSASAATRRCPAVVARVPLRVPIVLLEPNSVPGRREPPPRGAASRARLRRVRAETRAALAPGRGTRARALPLRPALSRRDARRCAADRRRKRLLVLGGSHGAHRSERASGDRAALELGAARATRRFVHQRGAATAKRVAGRLRRARRSRRAVRAFIDDMVARRTAARPRRLVAARGGATVAELGACGRRRRSSCPFPHAADDHQRATARAGARARRRDGAADASPLRLGRRVLRRARATRCGDAGARTRAWARPTARDVARPGRRGRDRAELAAIARAPARAQRRRCMRRSISGSTSSASAASA